MASTKGIPMTESAKVILTGRLARDAESRYTPNGAMNVSFSLPVTRRWKDRAGNDRNSTTWFRVTAWKDLAQQLDQLAQAGDLKKGTAVGVTGSIEQREYQNAEGETRFSLDVTAFEVSLIGQQGEVTP